MNSIIVRQMLGGDFYVISYDNEIPLVSTVRRQLYDVYVGNTGRNEIIMLFDISGSPITDNDAFVVDKEKNSDEKGDTISISMFVDREKKMKKEENEMVEKSLRSFMMITRPVVENQSVDLFEEFRLAIISTKAVVAGGSILSFFGGFTINDLDIYVNYSKGMELLTSLAGLGFKIRPYKCHHASQYESFFSKNNIQTRFYIERRSIENGYRMRQSIDVMIIPDGYDIENIVTNFDLSFCEIWWNGLDTFASDPYGVRHKSGILKPDYRKSLFGELNLFIIKRIQKYRKRGFSIDTCPNDFYREHPDMGVFSKKNKNSREMPENHKKWAMYHIRDTIENELNLFVRPLNRQSHAVSQFHFHSIYFKMPIDNMDEKLGDDRESISRLVYFKTIIHMSEAYRTIFKQVFKEYTFNDDDTYQQEDISPFLYRILENDITPTQYYTLRTEYARVKEQINLTQNQFNAHFGFRVNNE